MLHVLQSVLEWVDADQAAQTSQAADTAQTTQTTHTTQAPHLRLLDLTGNYATEQDSPRLHALCQELQKWGIVVEGLVLWNGASIRAA